jgi:hypothetical protein
MAWFFCVLDEFAKKIEKLEKSYKQLGVRRRYMY